MEWKEFEIEEVARLCGIQMKNDGMGAREIKALCPFCSDKHYHLYLNTEKNQWNCFRCGAKGKNELYYEQRGCKRIIGTYRKYNAEKDKASNQYTYEIIG